MLLHPSDFGLNAVCAYICSFNLPVTLGCVLVLLSSFYIGEMKTQRVQLNLLRSHSEEVAQPLSEL